MSKFAKELSPKTKEAILKLREKGIQFGIATGRTPYAVKQLVGDWGIESYTDLIMGFNGGSTLDMKTKELSNCYLLDGKYLKDIKETFKQFNVNMAIYDEQTCHALWEDQRVKGISLGNKLELIIDDLTQYESRSINKLLFVFAYTRVVAQGLSATGSGPVGRRFETSLPDKNFLEKRNSPCLS